MNDDEQRRLDEQRAREYEDQQQQANRLFKEQQLNEDEERQAQHRRQVAQSLADEEQQRSNAEANKTFDHQDQAANQQNYYQDSNEVQGLFNPSDDQTPPPLDDDYFNSIDDSQIPDQTDEYGDQIRDGQVYDDTQTFDQMVDQSDPLDQRDYRNQDLPNGASINAINGGAKAQAAARRRNEQQLRRQRKYADRRNANEQNLTANEQAAQQAKQGKKQTQTRHYLLAIDPLFLASDDTIKALADHNIKDNGEVMDKLRADLKDDPHFTFVAVDPTKENDHQMRVSNYLRKDKVEGKGLQPAGEKFKTANGLMAYAVIDRDWLVEHKEIAKMGAGVELDPRIDPKKLEASMGATKNGHSVNMIQYDGSEYPVAMTIPGKLAKTKDKDEVDELFDDESIKAIQLRAKQEAEDLRRRPKNSDLFDRARRAINQPGFGGIISAFAEGYQIAEHMKKTHQAKNQHQKTMDKLESMKAASSEAADEQSAGSNAESKAPSANADGSQNSAEVSASNEQTNQSKAAQSETPSRVEIRKNQSVLQRADNLRHDFVNFSKKTLANAYEKQAEKHEHKALYLRESLEELNQEVAEDEAKRYHSKPHQTAESTEDEVTTKSTATQIEKPAEEPTTRQAPIQDEVTTDEKDVKQTTQDDHIHVDQKQADQMAKKLDSSLDELSNTQDHSLTR